MPSADNRARWLWLAPSIVAFALVYLPNVGRGFVKDDFAWIAHSRIQSARDVARIFAQDNGFYRPAVSLSFGADRALHGLEPRGYGATNLALMVGTAVALAALGRALGLSPGGALLAGALWAFGPHGVPMSLLWLSGRTALLLCLFSALAAWAFVRGKTRNAMAWTLAALLAKEEAIALPAILFVWACLSGGDQRRWFAAARRTAPLAIPLVVYLLLRSRTGAYLPHTAPDFYRPTFALSTLARNVGEYFDRGATFGLAVALLASVVAWRRPALHAEDRTRIFMGAAWFAGGYALTVFLPVRSSLYACWPSAGAAVASATLVAAVWRDAMPQRRPRLLAAAIVVPFALVPAYWARSVRYTRPAVLSSQVVRDLRPMSVTRGEWIVLFDAPSERPNLAAAFGTLAQTAVRLAKNDATLRVWLEPPPGDWRASDLKPPPAGAAARALRLTEGRLVDATGQP